MTLEELLKATEDTQEVSLMLRGEAIIGAAHLLNTYLCVEIAQSDVDSVTSSGSILNVWVKE